MLEILFIHHPPPPTPGQNGCHFADIFICIFLNEGVCISIRLSLKFVPKDSNDNKIGSENGLVPNRWQAINWTIAGPVNQWIYPALEGDELTNMEIS